jgi:phenylacetic acid degradation operon negative regulatory protein
MRAAARPEPTPDPQVHRWVRRELASSPPRARSLIITVWGDAIAPHGGAVMLAGLIELLAPFGINERLVRTSVFRLARERWLAARPIGRQSLYRLTRRGTRRFEQAYRRIYAPPLERWDDTWEIVVANGPTAAQRRALRLELGWEGFGTLAPGVYVRPSQTPSAVPRIAAALGLSRRIIAARASDDAALGAPSLASSAPRAWDLSAVAADYHRFLVRFGSVIQRFRQTGGDAHDPGQSFVVRTLLIHAYRRVLLRDPQLPAALLPLDWPGAAAYALCRDFYRLTHRCAERHLIATLRNERGVLPPASPAFYRRFDGLD